MKKMWIVGVAVLMVAGMAGAQSNGDEKNCGKNCPPPPPPATGDSVNITTGGDSSSLTERISVSIPSVVAMHLHEKSWSLNLSDAAAVRANCYRAGNHNIATGRDDVDKIDDFMRHPGTLWDGDGAKDNNNAYSDVGKFVWDSSFSTKMKPAPGYPGIEYTSGNSAAKVTWKGPIVCFNRKVVEKFSNGSKGWEVSIKTNNVTDGFPTLILGDRVAGTTFRKVAKLYDAADNKSYTLGFTNEQAGMGRTTGGWLDDYILEALVFDGNETAGTKSADVVFTLTGKF